MNETIAIINIKVYVNKSVSDLIKTDKYLLFSDTALYNLQCPNKHKLPSKIPTRLNDSIDNYQPM